MVLGERGDRATVPVISWWAVLVGVSVDSNASNGQPGLPASSIAILMALLGAIFIQTFPFVGTRPSGPEMANHRAYGREDVRARLWEDPFGVVYRNHKDQHRYFVRQWREIFIYDWLAPAKDGRVDAQRLWREYQSKGRIWARIFRVAPTLVLIFLLVLEILEVFGYPEYPLRGNVSFRAFHWIAPVMFIGLIALIFFVADATRLCRRFIRNLTQAPTQWPQPVLAQFETEYCIDRDHIGECIDMGLIANRGLSERLQWMIDHIRAMKQGAFRALLQQPVIRALMWPLGGLALSLADYWTWSV